MSEPPPNAPSAQLANRLSIAHLLLWLASTSVVYGLSPQLHWSAVEESAGLPEFVVKEEREQRIHRLLRLIFAPVYGAAIMAALISGWRLANRRFGFPSQPGHWMLMVICVLAVGRGARIAAPENPLLAQWIPIAFVSLATLVSAIPIFSTHVPLRWKVVALFSTFILLTACWILVLGSSAGKLWMYASVLSMVVMCLGTLLSGLIAIGLDVWMRIPQDIFHWLGVGCLACVGAHGILFVTAPLFFA